MIKVRFAARFKKQYKKAGTNIQKCFDKRLEIFIDDPNNRLLNNHQLVGEYKGYGSINVNGDWRAIYSVVDDETVVFELPGTHCQLYG